VRSGLLTNMCRALHQAFGRGYDATDLEGFRARIEICAHIAKILRLQPNGNEDWANAPI
jgi:hypothetical protein